MRRTKSGENYDLSISDLFSGALFIFIILLVYFIIQFDDKKKNLTESHANQKKEMKQKFDDRKKNLTKPLIDRADLLENIQKELIKKNIKVIIDKVNGVMSIPINKECVYFKSGDYNLSDCGRDNFSKIKSVFKEVLPCYTVEKNNCRTGNRSLIDTVLIEGHTDYDPIGRSYRNSCTRQGRRKQMKKCKKKCKKLCKKYQGRAQTHRNCLIGCRKKCYDEKVNICIKNNFQLSTMRSHNVYSFLLDYREFEKKTPQGNFLYNLRSGEKKRIFGVAGFGPTRPTGKGKDYDRRIDFRFVMDNPKEIKKEIKKKLESRK